MLLTGMKVIGKEIAVPNIWPVLIFGRYVFFSSLLKQGGEIQHSLFLLIYIARNRVLYSSINVSYVCAFLLKTRCCYSYSKAAAWTIIELVKSAWLRLVQTPHVKGESLFTSWKCLSNRFWKGISNRERASWSDSSKTNEKHHGCDRKIN